MYKALSFQGSIASLGRLVIPGCFALAALSAGCGTPIEGDNDSAAVAEEKSALCVGRACNPPPVTPPTPDAITGVTTSEIGGSGYLISPATPTGYYTGEFTGLGHPNLLVSVEETTPAANTDVCSRTATEATIYAHSATLGYWYLYKSLSNTGSWVPASGFIPAHCDTAAGVTINNTTIDAVMVSGYASFCWFGTCNYRQVTESVSYYN